MIVFSFLFSYLLDSLVNMIVFSFCLLTRFIQKLDRTSEEASLVAQYSHLGFSKVIALVR